MLAKDAGARERSERVSRGWGIVLLLDGRRSLKMNWSLRLVLVLGLLGGGSARGEEDDDVRARVAEAIREGRRDVAYDALDLAVRRASQSNQPARLARLQLFRAELDAERPND